MTPLDAIAPAHATGVGVAGRAWRRGLSSVQLALCAALATGAVDVLAQAPAAVVAEVADASAEDLAILVGRIALYPDDLVAIILPASTNPLQIVQAERFLAVRKSNPQAAIDEQWDDAVKSLLNYPEVIKTMSGDLNWTSALGEAVIADQGEVLAAVQAFRRRAQAAGQLKSDDKQHVQVEQEVVSIVPADPQVIYVPQYDPGTVVIAGAAPYGYLPAPYPVYYYPYAPGAAVATGLIWGAALGAAWSGNRYGTNYGNNANINVNRNVNVNNGNVSANRSASGNTGSTAWRSNKQPGQVSGSTGGARAARAGDAGSTRAGAGAGAGAPRASQQPAGGSAFQGYGSGRQAQLDSSRGTASRAAPQREASGAGRAAPPARQAAAPRQAPAARSAPAGGGGRGGGGGGRGGGGGGGRGR